jgi:hypothetical protein
MKLKIILLLPLLGLLSSCSSPKWVAPENPKPQIILAEARFDFKNKKYETSLLKYIWINQHSLEHDYNFVGMRNSEALNEWYELGNIYPLALEKFHEFRNSAKLQVKQKQNMTQNFSDFKSFNELSGKQRETIDLFLWVEENTPFIVDSIHFIAKYDLFDAGRYDILNKYIKPNMDYRFAEENYRMMLNYNKGQTDNWNESNFIKEIDLLVTVLKNNNRLQEAEDIASKSLLIIKDPTFKTLLDSILSD